MDVPRHQTGYSIVLYFIGHSTSENKLQRDAASTRQADDVCKHSSNSSVIFKVENV